MRHIQNSRLLIIAFVAIAAAGAARGAKPVQCTPSPVTVTIQDGPYVDPSTAVTVSPRLTSDGKGPYRHGVDGVNAVIRDCPGETGDLTFGPGGSNGKNVPARKVNLDLTDVLYSDPSVTPSWAGQPLAIAGISVGNIIYNYNAGQNYSFTTNMGASGFPNVNYYLRIINPNKDTPIGWTPSLNANYPCDTAKVNVTHYPATNMSPETWVVWPDAQPTACSGSYSDPTRIAALVDSRRSWSSVLQSRVPFHITIQRQ